MRRLTVGNLFLLLIVFASAGDATSQTPSPTPSPLTPPTADTLSTAKADDLGGEYLTDGEGISLYVFSPDTPNQSECISSPCVAIWPPATPPSSDAPDIKGNVQKKLVGSPFERPDGTLQAVYGKLPLYYFNGDVLPNDRNGNCVRDFGGTWHLIKPDGTPYECASPSPSPTPPPPPPPAPAAAPVVPPFIPAAPNAGCGNYDVCGWTPGWRCYQPGPTLSQCRPECCRYTGESQCTGSNACGGNTSSSSSGSSGDNSCGSYNVCGWTPGWRCNYNVPGSNPPVGYRPECCYNAGDSSCQGYG